MTTQYQYLVRKVETCPVCKGDRFFQNADWERVNMAFDAWMKEHGKVRMDDEAYTEWKRCTAEAFPWGEPPEEEPCGECEGEGKIERWVPLAEAIQALGVECGRC